MRKLLSSTLISNKRVRQSSRSDDLDENSAPATNLATGDLQSSQNVIANDCSTHDLSRTPLSHVTNVSMENLEPMGKRANMNCVDLSIGWTQVSDSNNSNSQKWSRTPLSKITNVSMREMSYSKSFNARSLDGIRDTERDHFDGDSMENSQSIAKRAKGNCIDLNIGWTQVSDSTTPNSQKWIRTPLISMRKMSPATSLNIRSLVDASFEPSPVNHTMKQSGNKMSFKCEVRRDVGLCDASHNLEGVDTFNVGVREIKRNHSNGNSMENSQPMAKRANGICIDLNIGWTQVSDSTTPNSQKWIRTPLSNISNDN